MSMPTTETLERVYGDAASEARERFGALAARYRELFGPAEDADLSSFTAPGRTEIIGNHTDHNGGKILAASITMDTIAVAAPNGSRTIHIVSEGYPDPVVVDIDALDAIPHCQGTLSLVAGMVQGFIDRGYVPKGFNATVSSQVIPSAGVSSSASFEMLVCSIINHLFCGDAAKPSDYARIGQFAENAFWDKASGLMDQMACAVGGTIELDFAHGVDYRSVDFGFDALGCDLVIVNTGAGHADLSDEYSAVPAEMRAVAAALGVENLCQTTEEALLADLPRIRTEVGSDRAVMRALHYFEECARVDEAAAALEAGDKERVLALISASGNSSWKWLQNAYVPGNPAEQPIPVALALTEIYLHKVGAGVCRLHGGGFAGVIMCVIPHEHTQGYVDYMAGYLGAGNVYRTNIRQTGAVCLG